MLTEQVRLLPVPASGRCTPSLADAPMPELDTPSPEHADIAGDASVSDADLQALLLQARTGDDARLRQLVTSYVTLRRVTADVLAFIQAREGGAAVAGVPLLLRARQLVGTPKR
jgi:hypothetical protein